MTRRYGRRASLRERGTIAVFVFSMIAKMIAK
jgi:hypothetical protein